MREFVIATGRQLILLAPKTNPPSLLADFSRTDISIVDDFLSRQDQEGVLSYLLEPGWAYGAYSSTAPAASRYWFKHFAGYFKETRDVRTAVDIEAELMTAAPTVSRVWSLIKSKLAKGHTLTRCYANGYPNGAEGGLHTDSNAPNHHTFIYYPHFKWDPNYAGETVFFNRDGADIIASIYPRPNRLIAFPGIVPHIARGVARCCPELRMTLMFKTELVR